MEDVRVRDLLDDEIFICMICKGEFDVTQGTWPQNDSDGNPMLNADFNDRARFEFMCYDCAG